MRTLTAHHDGIEIAYQRFGTIGDPLLLIMGIGADIRYWHDDFCNALVRNGFQYDALRAVLTDNLPEDDQRRLETRIEMSFWERALNYPKLLDVQRRESAKLQRMLRELIE